MAETGAASERPGASSPASERPGASSPASERPGARRRGHPGLSVVALLVVLGVALAIGSGVGAGGGQTQAQRAATIDSQVRCPSCADLSVAQSSASAAVAVRQEVAHLVSEGRSNRQVEDTLVGQYGPTILLRPPTSGLISLVWFVPALGAAVALGVLGAFFWRRSRDMARLRRDDL
ncbi:MAG: cytochrome c-type biogenesis protein [Acidimicrobiales bacterium]